VRDSCGEKREEEGGGHRGGRGGKNREKHKRKEREKYMGWLWLVGSIKLQVSFAEYSLLYRALLRKKPII